MEATNHTPEASSVRPDSLHNIALPSLTRSKGPHAITDAAAELSAMVSVSAGASVQVAEVSEVSARAPELLHPHRRPPRLAAESSVAQAGFALGRSNRTYHRTYRAAD